MSSTPSRGTRVGRTLTMAREMRAAGVAAVMPSTLYAAAQTETREHYAATPALIADKTRELYRHAMIEAGALIPKGASGPSTRCPVCGWESEANQQAREQRVFDAADRYKQERDHAYELLRRAGPFVTAVAAMADDKTPALAWLADAAQVAGSEVRRGK